MTEPSSNDSEKKLNRETLILGAELKHWWVLKVLGPLERVCIKRGIEPNTITLVATSLYLIGMFLYATGHVLLAGWFVLFLGSLDILDGRVARATGKVTKTGGFLDSVMDRYQDFFLYGGLCFFYREQALVLILILFAILGSMVVPYVRAKSDSLGIDLANIGVMQRPERVFLLGFGSIISSMIQVSLMPFYGYSTTPPQHVLIGVIFVLAVSTNITAWKRITHTISALR